MSNQPNSSLPKVQSPSSLAHLVLRSNNFHNMVSFYSNFLGASVVFSNEAMAFLTYDDEHHRIAIMNLSTIGPKDPRTSGLEHMAFAFSSLEDLALAWQQRKAHGIEPFWAVHHGPTISVYYHDPDGNVIETQVDTMSAEKATEFMYSEEFGINPVGVDIKMEDLVKRLESGEDRAEVLERPKSGPREPHSVPGFVA